MMNTRLRSLTKHIVLITVVLVGGLLLLSACGEPLRERTIEITATEMRFDPDRVEAQTGEQIFIRLRNRGQVAHSFTIELPAGDRTVSADPGVDAILTFRAPAPGEYRFYCRIPGHEAQQGVLVVLP
ncbi:cupredoxin domain-containing protein [Chloroflexus aggregans]|nr:cupredoxin domain-containing protein [Chloroflexus aggregans]